MCWSFLWGFVIFHMCDTILFFTVFTKCASDFFTVITWDFIRACLYRRYNWLKSEIDQLTHFIRVNALISSWIIIRCPKRLMAAVDMLNDDVLIIILIYCNVHDLRNICLVNRRFKRVSEDSMLWKRLYESEKWKLPNVVDLSVCEIKFIWYRASWITKGTIK